MKRHQQAPGAFVLENKLGQVVRTFKWSSDSMTLIYRHDVRRIEAARDLQQLEDDAVEYVKLAEVRPADIKNESLSIADVGTLRWTEEVTNISPSVKTEDEPTQPYWTSLKWSASSAIVLLSFAFVVNHFVQSRLAQETGEQQVVKIVPRPKPQIVAPVIRHVVTHRAVTHHKKIRRAVTPMKIARKTRHRSHHHEIALNQIGALATFGSLKHSRSHGGLNLNAVKTSRGPGLGGGTEGSGGVQTSLYAKGLLSAPLGPGARAEGAGGYGTHGRGGGQAGYGALSLVGSSRAYFEPVERDAEIEGGLDREQIAAVIQRHIGQIRYCYEQGLQERPGLSGRVAVRFYIGGTGLVKTASVANTSLHSDGVENCITRRLRSWKFPEPRGGVIVKVTYPFVLKRVSQS